MTKRIYHAICLASFCVLAACLVLLTGAQYTYFTDQRKAQLKAQTELAVQGTELNGMEYLTGVEMEGYRITWIDGDGTVLYDSETDAAGMENHSDREEFQEAESTGYGESSRYSATLTQRLLYSAMKLDDGSVIRLAAAQYTIPALLAGMIQPIAFLILIVLLGSLYLASRLSKKIVKPLNELDLDHPLETETYDELAPVLRRMDRQQKQIQKQKQTLAQKQDEFQAVTGNMEEGLVLLNPEGVILSINKAAMSLFQADENCISKDFLTLNRSLSLQDLLHTAENGKHAETDIQLNGRDYQADASPVFRDRQITGTVLLLFDVTEKDKAEQMRREFTANVSHELKTPLHSISGCAELLNQDMVKPEDRKQFTGQILQESRRMIHLVDDIISLSHLDEEDMTAQKESVNLLELAQKSILSLQNEADAAGVTVTCTGEPAHINGVPQLLSSIFHNLIDNGIQYNHAGGTVSVNIEDHEQEAVVTVSDDGIGIAPEDQSRVFERFYRVDRSRSKAGGGTGLGLSIVKHACIVHHASVDLRSEPGKGSVFTIHFPKEKPADTPVNF